MNSPCGITGHGIGVATGNETIQTGGAYDEMAIYCSSSPLLLKRVKLLLVSLSFPGCFSPLDLLAHPLWHDTSHQGLAPLHLIHLVASNYGYVAWVMSFSIKSVFELRRCSG